MCQYKQFAAFKLNLSTQKHIKKPEIRINTAIFRLYIWQGQKDLNPRHVVLETTALPTELYPYVLTADIILSFSAFSVNTKFQNSANFVKLPHWT